MSLLLPPDGLSVRLPPARSADGLASGRGLRLSELSSLPAPWAAPVHRRETGVAGGAHHALFLLCAFLVGVAALELLILLADAADALFRVRQDSTPCGPGR